MRVLPILFNTDMVRAILEGRKTVTRRLVKFVGNRNANWTGYIKDGLVLYNGTNEPCNIPCGYQPGDILYVRETWYKGLNRILYKANYAENEKFYENGKEILVKWHPSIHMPKEAARIFLKVKDVHVEQLQDITIDEIRSEGLTSMAVHAGDKKIAYAEWQLLWDSTVNKKELDKYGWSANPWVWVIELERCEKPENFLAEIGKE